MKYERRSIVFNSLRKRVRQACLLGCVSGAALLVLAVGSASAATYGSSTFTGSAEGWFAPVEECKLLGIVELGVLCENKGEYSQAAGDPPGSLDAHTKGVVNLVSAFNSKVTLQSPDFTVATGGPATLHLDRQMTLTGLLKLGPNSGYKVVLLDKSTGTPSILLEHALTAEDATFVGENAAVTVVAGHTYAIQIQTEAASGAQLGLLNSTTDIRFDNVSLTVGGGGGETPGGGGGGGGNGGNGGGGEGGETIPVGKANGGSGNVSSARLESLIRSSSLIGPAVLKGNRLTVKAACPKKVGTTCTLTIQGQLTRKKAATTARRARVKQGKQKQFALKVKPAALAQVKARKKLLFKETVRAGKARTTVWKSLKLVRK
jgi:hypothetical protein